jgi:hypothetical protein
MDKHEFLAVFKVSFAIATMIFFTAILSDFSVRMYYDSTDWVVRIFSGLIAIAAMTVVITLFLLWIPYTRKAILRMFGFEEEPQKEKPS